ncbi:Importin-5 [Quillaja saponaria]|uniref:Importin-5 n=1 Tax=Quillaja saponaria TaxID=32244 RepID=A0AAD7PZ56_QUISA|nr:Importin-5 [Quillaja saponaria]
MPELLHSAKLAFEKGQSQGCNESYIKQLSDCIIPALVEALHKEPEIEICASIFDALNECIQGKDKTAEERRIAVCIFDDVVDHCHEAVLKCLQAAVYGIGICAEFGGSVFKHIVGEALSKLDTVIRHPNALHSDNVMAHDNVVSTLGKICQFHHGSINATQVCKFPPFKLL